MPDRTPDEHHDRPARDTAAESTVDFVGGQGDCPGAADSPSDEQRGLIIPKPRSPLDDSPDLDLPPPHRQRREPGLVEPDFRYDQTWLRGKSRRYHGYVEWIGGEEGERLREDIAAAVRDLLGWAARHDGINRTAERESRPGPDDSGRT